jgi:hypothetical protein
MKTTFMRISGHPVEVGTFLDATVKPAYKAPTPELWSVTSINQPRFCFVAENKQEAIDKARRAIKWYRSL